MTYLTVSWLDHSVLQELHENQIGEVGQTSLVVSVDSLDQQWIGKGSPRLHVHCSSTVLTFSWLMSGRNTHFCLYSARLNGSCQNSAWTRLKEKSSIVENLHDSIGSLSHSHALHIFLVSTNVEQFPDHITEC